MSNKKSNSKKASEVTKELNGLIKRKEKQKKESTMVNVKHLLELIPDARINKRKDGYVSQRNDNVVINQDATLHFSLVSEDTDGKEGGGDSTPGFELFLIICAIMFLLLLKRKKT